MRFRTILADPPWSFRVWSKDTGSGRSAIAHYPTQGAEWIKSLPVPAVADRDCVLLLWATCPTLPEALEVIRAWDFEYKTVAFSWAKVRGGKPQTGMGYWTRANAELCLLATRGKPRRKSKAVQQLILCPRGRHSRKPEAQYPRIEELLEGPYLEMFARPDGGLYPPREGWTRLGNEITGRDMADDLRLLSEVQK